MGYVYTLVIDRAGGNTMSELVAGSGSDSGRLNLLSAQEPRTGEPGTVGSLRVTSTGTWLRCRSRVPVDKERTWVGIGGFDTDDLVQAGTEADNIGGSAQYDAWTEILPAAEVVIPDLTIHPGDKIKTTVKETSPGVWKMKVKDVTTGQSGGKTVDYSSSGESVEAIHERPEVGSGLATLADTSNVTFDPGKYSDSGAGSPVWNPLLVTAVGSTVYQIWMVNNADTAYIAVPSNPDSDSDGFTVQYGSTQPPPPSS